LEFFIVIHSKQRGFTFVETLVGLAILVVVIFGLYGTFQLGLQVVGQSRARAAALALANQRIEMIRNLSYQDVGTEGGIPAGSIPQSETVIRNNIEYTLETSIVYIDDPFDGLAPDDTLPTDYKRARVKVTWSGKLAPKTPVVLITDIAPKGIETEAGGGTIAIKVFDASAAPVVGALVHIENNQVEPPINADYETDTEGSLILPGAPTSTEAYMVTVTKTGYSSERTYATNEIVNGVALASPNKPHLTVLEGQLTEASFDIDQISTKSVDTVEPAGEDAWQDSFDDQSKIAELSGLTVSGGEVKLSYTQGVEFTGGTTDGDLCSFPGIDGDCGQSFTMGDETREISQIELYLKKATDDPSDFYLELRSESTIGPIMASSTLQDAATLPVDLDWITFALQSPVTLLANTQYFLRLRSQPDSTDPEAGAQGYIYWGYVHSDTSPPAYADGDAWRYIGRNNNPDDPGQQLGPDDQYDFSFRIYQSAYAVSGYLISTTIAPEALIQWQTFSWTDNESAETDIKYHLLYYDGSDWVLIPETDLPGNGAGFDDSPVDLSGLDINQYSQIRLRGDFTTTNPDLTPSLADWQVTWQAGAIPIPNLDFHMQGAKTLGTDADGNPVYKYLKDLVTDTDGHLDITDLEWDTYDITIDGASTGYDLAESCPPQPVDILPNTTNSTILTLVPHANHTLLVIVKDVNNNVLEGASVRLYRTGYDETLLSSACGQVFFTPLDQAAYTLEVTLSGYEDYSISVDVEGQTEETVIMTVL
jgi:prepilin-type N-terminal cleavage/methylation domain-containing protein